MEVPLDATKVVFESEFLAGVAAVQIAGKQGPVNVPKPTALKFDTRPSDACHSFQIIYSAHNRQVSDAKPSLRIRPRAPAGQSCTASLDVGSVLLNQRVEIVANAAIDLVLAIQPSSALIENQVVRGASGPARVVRGGPAALLPTEVKVTRSVSVGGTDLAIDSLSLSNEDPDGELRVVLVAKKLPSVTVDGTDLSWIHRFKIVMHLVGLVKPGH